LGIIIQYFKSTFLIFKIGWCPGAAKSAALLPVAIDNLFLDEPLNEREGIVSVGQHPFGAPGIDRRRLAAEALADIDPAADRTAIARARPFAERALLEHDRVDAVLRQFERRGEAGIAAADDRDARRTGDIDQIAGDRPISRPPIRRRLEIGVENALQ
jgi:hypothetical protein